MNVVAILQARMGSSRLPGKVLMDLAGEPMLGRCMRRLRDAQRLSTIWVATSVNPRDQAIARLCEARGWHCFRGSENDVLDRYYQTACQAKADVVVRTTSDCPLIDPGLVDRVIQEFLDRQPGVDYASNTHLQRTFPRGLDTEVFRIDTLERAWREDQNPASREHVTPYIYRNPQLFRVHGVANDVDFSDMRWTVDTPEDLAFVRRVFGHFGNDQFSWQDALKVLQKCPEWLSINRNVQQKAI